MQLKILEYVRIVLFFFFNGCHFYHFLVLCGSKALTIFSILSKLTTSFVPQYNSTGEILWWWMFGSIIFYLVYWYLRQDWEMCRASNSFLCLTHVLFQKKSGDFLRLFCQRPKKRNIMQNILIFPWVLGKRYMVCNESF